MEKKAEAGAGHWFYSFFANDWHRSTKSNEQRMHEPFTFELSGASPRPLHAAAPLIGPQDGR